MAHPRPAIFYVCEEVRVVPALKAAPKLRLGYIPKADNVAKSSHDNGVLAITSATLGLSELELYDPAFDFHGEIP